MCPSCGNHNFASREVCNKCAAPKAGGAGGGFGAVKKQATANRAMPFPAAAGPAAIGTMRPGDWCCSACGNHNFANREVCNKCKMPKMASMMGGMGMFQGMTPQIMANMMPGMMNAGNAKPTGAMRPGDWKCHACGNINFASRTHCNKAECGVAKSAYISKSGMRPGDWLCPMCENHNFSDKTECVKCKHPRGNTPLSMHNMKEGDWLCPMCNNHNYQDKIVCNRCQAPRQPRPSQMSF